MLDRTESLRVMLWSYWSQRSARNDDSCMLSFWVYTALDIMVLATGVF